MPTGSPIANTLFNFYLIPLDNALAVVPGGFYARYSDDLLFAHPDPWVAREAEARLTTTLEGLHLEANRSKAADLFFNGAGRPSPAWAEAKGTPTIAFLGCHVGFDGTVALKPAKLRRLLNDLKVRIRRTLKELPNRDPHVTGPVICSVVNEALNPVSPCRQKSAVLLDSIVTSRPQLKQLDYSIARIITAALTGDSTVRAFRRVPYRTLRQRWQLVSLYHQRNQKRAVP